MSRYIVFEGLDGAGKDTAITLAQDWLEESGRTVVRTRTPSELPVGQLVQQYFGIAQTLWPDIERRSMFFGAMMIADMLHHDVTVRAELKDSAKDDKWVLQSRNWISTWCYQGVTEAIIQFLHGVIPQLIQPHALIYFRADIDVCLERIKKRDKGTVDVFEHRENLERVLGEWEEITSSERENPYDRRHLRVASPHRSKPVHIPFLEIDTTNTAPHEVLKQIQGFLSLKGIINA